MVFLRGNKYHEEGVLLLLKNARFGCSYGHTLYYNRGNRNDEGNNVRQDETPPCRLSAAV